MSAPADGYDAYYQARLWDSVPEIYRALDSVDAAAAGPLRELLNRIGVQAAVVRRSIDGLWADQFIETCSDWVVPYLGALVATGQVTGLDPRGQRLDVANTIHWGPCRPPRQWGATSPAGTRMPWRGSAAWPVPGTSLTRRQSRPGAPSR
jgi:hypothetical protein